MEVEKEEAAAEKRKNYVSHFFMTLKSKLENLRKSCREIKNVGGKANHSLLYLPLIRYKQEISSQLHMPLVFLS